MNIAIIGYGKMGKAIETIANSRGHEIGLKVTSANADFSVQELESADVAIEFTRPEAAESNILKCFEANVPVVVGTTGWYDQFDRISEQQKAANGGLFHATNFSLGVNIFFEINRVLARIMNQHDNYEVSMEEIHHVHKLDSPSGTAITIAEGLLAELEHKNGWTENSSEVEKNNVFIDARREGEVPGTHIVHYNSEIDHLEIKHEAHNRKGFALGSVLAAEFMHNKSGVYTMKDLLNLNNTINT